MVKSRSSNEFSRVFDVSRLKNREREENLVADEDECKALAQRLKVPAVRSFEARFVLNPWNKTGVHLKGEFDAVVTLTCVVSLEDFETRLNGPVERFFSRAADGHHEEVLDLEDIDEDTPDIIENERIDLADIAAESLALAIDPYPRKPGASFSDHIESKPEDDGDNPEKPNPFAVLEKLKKH